MVVQRGTARSAHRRGAPPQKPVDHQRTNHRCLTVSPVSHRAKLVYIDSSVALAVAFREEGWEDLVAAFRTLRSDGFRAASSTLLRAEVRRVYIRGGRSLAGADESVAWINLVELDDRAVSRAGEFAAHVKTLDAIHIAAAQLLDDEETLLLMWTLDQEMARAARQLGLELVEVDA